MTTIGPQRDQMIRNAVMRRPEAIADVSVDLWEKLACGLISIIGEGGFQSLYKRSLHLTSATFPWMESHPSSLQKDTGFADLKICLAEQDPTVAGEASTALLITFIDILALLIGELLMSSILRLAWGDDALDTVVKELP
ncbi:hypothetical protein [Herminiimonas sp.]|uniref:hypothetical protein n=1 Tax=Herminiimonas sp. TaxID=1926289 RepID=UPI00272AB243|nr:hypothetical protein [Herminiimonas sp.]